MNHLDQLIEDTFSLFSLIVAACMASITSQEIAQLNMNDTHNSL